MNYSFKAGGLSAIVLALCYIFGFALLSTAMYPENADRLSQLQKLEFVLERQNLFVLWNMIIYVVFGVALVGLTATLHQALQHAAPLIMSLATPFGFIWSGLVIASGMIATVGLATVDQTYTINVNDAVLAWQIIGAIQNGIGGGVEVIGGLWVLLISLAALCGKTILPKLLNWLGLVVGAAGIVTLVPALSGFGAVFGLLQIVWFIGVGISMLRKSNSQKVVATQA